MCVCPRNFELVYNCVVCDNYWVDSLCDSDAGEDKSLWLGVDCNCIASHGIITIPRIFLNTHIPFGCRIPKCKLKEQRIHPYNSISFHSRFTNSQSRYTFRAKAWFHKNHFGKLTIHSKFQSLDFKNFKYIIKRATYIYEVFSYFSFGLCYCRYFSYIHIYIPFPVPFSGRITWPFLILYMFLFLLLSFVSKLFYFILFFHFSLTKLITTTNYKYI